MTEGYVQVPGDSVGKKIDSEELYNYSGTLVERQRVSVPDEVDVNGEFLVRMLVELRLHSLLLAEGLEVRDNIDDLRDDLLNIAGLTIPTVRELVTADRTYYARVDGSDNNTGLDDSASGAVRTAARALQLASEVDGNGYDLTIKLGAGVWTPQIVLIPMVGFVNNYLRGDTANPANVILSVTDAHAIKAQSAGPWNVGGFDVRTISSIGSTDWDCIEVNYGSLTIDADMIFGAASRVHIFSGGGGNVLVVANTITINGSAYAHLYAFGGGGISHYPGVVNGSGVRAFSRAFAIAELIGEIDTSTGFSGTGSFTGIRYELSLNAVIQTYGSGANYFPGDVAGTFVTGGQYS